MSITFDEIQPGMTLFERQLVSKKVKANGQLVPRSVMVELPVTILEKFGMSARVKTEKGESVWFKSRLVHLHENTIEQDNAIKNERKQKQKNRRVERKNRNTQKEEFLNSDVE